METSRWRLLLTFLGCPHTVPSVMPSKVPFQCPQNVPHTRPEDFHREIGFHRGNMREYELLVFN